MASVGPLLRVLVVDDSRVTVKKITAIFEQLGHQVVGVARSGHEALEAYRTSNPDLVTMDITMPDVDGVEATRLVLAEFPAANVIMVTARGQERMVVDSLRAGAKGYVLKPVVPERLAEMVAKVRLLPPAE
ncbi:MAG: response regulator [Magnetospirillum sp.]|nr:response regulator [Magnetospirillum sp.]